VKEEPMAASSEKIFIVDDDAPVRQALSRLLRSCGFDVHAFSSAQEFLSAVSPEASVHGCLILDVKMPDMNGLDLQERIKASGWELPIIFITAYDEPKDREKALANGGVAFLQKPLSEKDLLKNIRSALKANH
jgi:two-component system response regulator FixJ